MAKDDYFVIVYQILAYLYRSLKEGTDVDPKMLESRSILFNINEKYRMYVLENMQKQGFIEGVQFMHVWGGNAGCDTTNIQITPVGIEYLLENSAVKKAYRFLKEVKGFIPFDLI